MNTISARQHNVEMTEPYTALFQSKTLPFTRINELRRSVQVKQQSRNSSDLLYAVCGRIKTQNVHEQFLNKKTKPHRVFYVIRKLASTLVAKATKRESDKFKSLLCPLIAECQKKRLKRSKQKAFQLVPEGSLARRVKGI